MFSKLTSSFLSIWLFPFHLWYSFRCYFKFTLAIHSDLQDYVALFGDNQAYP
jgi:hypothetical protein